ncbi:MAG: AAA family ATPase [Micrococcales bacterium]|nr:AAA family ATPase [Micrococcales bacterium]MCL2666280.1 AAA family ATPase [Micrococcales bacterium]
MVDDAGPVDTSSLTPADELQRPPAEVRFADELRRLRQDDTDPVPPGWALSLTAARRFVMGDAKAGVSPKFVGDTALVERALVTLATQRGLLLIGEPGTAKSLLSELLAAAVSGDSTLTIQGGAATTEDQIKYSWNYALLVAEGPSRRALVPAPMLRGMSEGKTVRFEEITRCPLEVQDGVLSLLSERAVAIPELGAPDAMTFARQGFAVIATANTRDRGVNEMSAALKRRFSFETVFPIADPVVELDLVERESTRLLERSGVTRPVPRDLLEVLVTTFRELRTGTTSRGESLDSMSTVLSTAEAVSVAHAVGLRGWYLRQGASDGVDFVECLAGTAAKDNPDDMARLRRYFDHHGRRSGPAWRSVYAARHRLG